MPELNRAPRILFSNANLAETANVLNAPHRPILSPRAVGKFATRVGADGVDWHPAYPTIPGSAKSVASAVKKGHILDLTLHQSFNEDPYKTELAGLQQHILASKLGQRLIMPGTRESVVYMAEVQRCVNAKLPIVYYPNARAEDDYHMLKVGGSDVNLFQPTAKLLETWGVDSAQGFHDEASVRRFFTCFDTNHGQRGGKFDLLLTGAAPLARAVHLAVARYDMPDPHIDTANDLAIARSGNYRGPIGETFDAIDEQGNLDYVVIEAPISGVVQATGYTALHDIAQVYTELIDGVRERYA